MSRVLAHRGPDDHGLLWKGPCGLAHRRLSVIDLTPAGRQPMGNPEGTVWIVYNGEVYNFRELSRRFGLEQRGPFRSRTDTEVVLRLYETLGPSFPEHLDGMFSLAVWDSRRDLLLLARDPFGIKPLFYREHRGALWFASEIKALLQVPGAPREADPEALFHYLALNYVPGDLTAFRGITELEPGTTLEYRPGKGVAAVRRFFDLEYRQDPGMDMNTAVEESRRLLGEAVDRQLVSDVPVGVMLSGGLDSSALAALMARSRGGGDFHTFSLAFREPSFDESRYAAMVAGRLGTEHHTIQVLPEKVAELLPGCLAHIDEPYADGSAVPTMMLSGEAAPLVTVLLSGEGGDEVFAGYDTHAAMKARAMYRRWVPGFIRRGVAGPAARMLPVSRRKLSFEFKAKRFTSGCELGVPESHFAWRAVLTGAARERIFPGACSGGFPGTEEYFAGIYRSRPGETDLSRILRIDSSCHLPHDLMIKNDRMTMAYSVEARVPFTDTALVRFLATVPDGIKLPGLRKKNLLRRAMSGALPGPVLRKKKVGLEMPYSEWFRSSLKGFSRETIFSSGALSSGLLDRRGIEALWLEHHQGSADHGRALWGILNYALWYDLYLASTRYLDHILPGRSRL
jgi:asparagine synthase (glutamine-hydrolysing)